MQIQVTTQAVRDVAGDALVVAATRKKGENNVQLSTLASEVDKLLDGLISERSAEGEFKGGLGEILTIHPLGRLAVKRVVVVGLGTHDALTTQAVRRASAIAARHLQHTGAQHI